MTNRVIASPATYAWRYMNGERPSASQVIFGVGANAAFGAAANAGLAAVGVNPASSVISTAIVNNAGLPIDWLAVGTDAAAASAVRGVAAAGAGAVGIAFGSALDAFGGAVYDAFTWNGQ